VDHDVAAREGVQLLGLVYRMSVERKSGCAALHRGGTCRYTCIDITGAIKRIEYDDKLAVFVQHHWLVLLLRCNHAHDTTLRQSVLYDVVLQQCVRVISALYGEHTACVSRTATTSSFFCWSPAAVMRPDVSL
jgi:hypothetical protein